MIFRGVCSFYSHMISTLTDTNTYPATWQEIPPPYTDSDNLHQGYSSFTVTDIHPTTWQESPLTCTASDNLRTSLQNFTLLIQPVSRETTTTVIYLTTWKAFSLTVTLFYKLHMTISNLNLYIQSLGRDFTLTSNINITMILHSDSFSSSNWPIVSFIYFVFPYVWHILKSKWIIYFWATM